MIDFVYWIKAYLLESAEGWVVAVKSHILRVLLSLIILVILLWISVFSYGSFYYLYMPTVSYTKPVNFQFRPPMSSDCGAVAYKRDTSDYMCSFPTANLSLLGHGQDWLMVKGQGYRVSVELDMPESPNNQEMGMFLVKMEAYARDGTIVRSSQRSAMLRYRSLFLQTIETLCFTPLLLSGITEQKQLITVELFDNFMEDAFKPTAGVIIVLQSYKIQLYSAVLKIHAQFTGLRYIIYRWPITSAFVGISTNMFFLLTIAFFSWFRFLWTKTEGPTLERIDSRRVLFDQPLPDEERRRNIEMMSLEDEEMEESSQSSNSSSPETIEASPTERSIPEEGQKSSSEEDTVVIHRGDLEAESESSLRLRQTRASLSV